MAINDYEYYSNTPSTRKYQDPSGAWVYQNILPTMLRNTGYIAQIKAYFASDNALTNLLNVPMLKATKLREDLHVITTYVYNPTTKKSNYFTFVVNDHSLYKRFKIYESKDSTIFYTKENYSPKEYINKMMNPSSFVKIKFYQSEWDDLELINSMGGSNNYSKYGFNKSNICNIVGFQSFSKRMWIALLTPEFDDYALSTSKGYYTKEYADKYN